MGEDYIKDYKRLTVVDIALVLPIYLQYYNEIEGGSWTDQKATARIQQMVTIQDSFGLIALQKGVVVAFCMGYFRQYDDVITYNLDEIVVATDYRNKGIGSAFLEEIFAQVQQLGASGVELLSVNDEQHAHFYAKAGFKDAQNFVPKVKWLQS